VIVVAQNSFEICLIIMRIDAHQHFWKYNTSEYSWISDQMKVLKRDFLPGDLQASLFRPGQSDGFFRGPLNPRHAGRVRAGGAGEERPHRAGRDGHVYQVQNPDQEPRAPDRLKGGMHPRDGGGKPEPLAVEGHP